MGLELTNQEYESMYESMVHAYMNKVWDFFIKRQNGCVSGCSDDIDISLHSLVTLKHRTVDDWAENPLFCTTSNEDVFDIYNIVNQI